MTFHVAFRGYAGGRLLFEDVRILDTAGVVEEIRRLALKHARAIMSHESYMIELEFLDEPDPKLRFARFGSDPDGMIEPILFMELK